jgi:sarcosine oxidase gamma subunit
MQTLCDSIIERRLMMMLSIQDDMKLPNDLGTAHEVILIVRDAYSKLKYRYEEQSKSLQEALAEIRFLRSGKKQEKFINADQWLLESPEDNELQAALEAAKKETEQQIIEITHNRTRKAKSSPS